MISLILKQSTCRMMSSLRGAAAGLMKQRCYDHLQTVEVKKPQEGVFAMMRLWMVVPFLWRHGRILFQLVCGGYSQTPCKSIVSFLLFDCMSASPSCNCTGTSTL